MRISIPKFHCDIVFAQEHLNELTDFLTKNRGAYSSCALFSNNAIHSLYGKQIISLINAFNLPTHSFFLPEGESAKTLESLTHCWHEMHQKGLDRKSLVIGLGGGTVMDTAGFAAACYMRGIDHINIPTTLLAMVDASIGGKTGVNLSTGKNIIGAYRHPRLVIIAPHYLNSLPDRELRSGLAEMIKAGIIWDADLVEVLEKRIPRILAKDQEKIKTVVARACKIKVEVIRLDEKEKDLRSILNYGHTFAHAIETLTHYSTLTHGEAVSIGMHCAAHVSREFGFVDNEFIKRQGALCQLAGLPIDLPKSIDLKVLVEQMTKDKKNTNGKINLILPRKIGKVDKIFDVEMSLIHRALTRIDNFIERV